MKPTTSPISQPTPAPSCALVIFGARGDLTKRLVVPALYNLLKLGLLPDRFAVVGVDHNEQTAEDWRNGVHDFVEAAVKQKGGEFHPGSIDETAWNQLAGRMSYITGDFLEPDTYKRLGEHLADIDGAQSWVAGCCSISPCPNDSSVPLLIGSALPGW